MLVSDRTAPVGIPVVSEQQIVGNPTTVFPQRDLGEGLSVFVVLLEVWSSAVQPSSAVGGMVRRASQPVRNVLRLAEKVPYKPAHPDAQDRDQAHHADTGNGDDPHPSGIPAVFSRSRLRFCFWFRFRGRVRRRPSRLFIHDTFDISHRLPIAGGSCQVLPSYHVVSGSSSGKYGELGKSVGLCAAFGRIVPGITRPVLVCPAPKGSMCVPAAPSEKPMDPAVVVHIDRFRRRALSAGLAWS